MSLRDYTTYALGPLRERAFSYESYEALLTQLSAPRFRVVPLCQYDDVSADDRVLVGLRHDIDADLDSAIEMAALEHRRGLRATYFVLHSASYYGVIRRGRVRRRSGVLRALLAIQNRYGHEVGWHNDLVTLQVVYGINALAYAAEELGWLRAQGVRITGTAAHGSRFAARYGYDNRYLFSDLCVEHRVPFADAPNHHEVTTGRGRQLIPKTTLAALGFSYEAYHLRHRLNPTDSDIAGGRRWHPNQLDLAALVPGDRMILLTHPVHWGSPAKKYRRAVQRFVGNRIARALGGS